MSTKQMNDNISFPFLKSWVPTPDATYIEEKSADRFQLDRSAEGAKKWEDRDFRELSLERDVWATAKICELLGMSSFDEAVNGFAAAFGELADMGYAGYCYYNFASVSRKGLFNLYDQLGKQWKGNDFRAVYELKSIHEDLFARESGSRGEAKILLFNKCDPDGYDCYTHFGRNTAFDSRYGENEEETQLFQARRIKNELLAENSQFIADPVPINDGIVLAMMDLVNVMFPQPKFDRLAERGHEHLYRHSTPDTNNFVDIAAGFSYEGPEGKRIPTMWTNADFSVAIDVAMGVPELRRGFALAAKIVDGTNTKDFPFIRPWEVNTVDEFKSWTEEDLRELQLDADLNATAVICERLGMCTFDEAVSGFKSHFEELADMGYAGSAFYDFASVPVWKLVRLYEEFWHERFGEDGFGTHVYDFPEDRLNACDPGSPGKVKFRVKQARKRDNLLVEKYFEKDFFFGLEKSFDTSLGYTEENTIIHLTNNIRAKFDRSHRGYRAFGLDYRENTVVALMDMINETRPKPRYEKLTLRAGIREFAMCNWDVPNGPVGPKQELLSVIVYANAALYMVASPNYPNDRQGCGMGFEKL